MWEMYSSLVKYIWSGDIKDGVEIKFIDVINDDIDKYPGILDILRKGYVIPLVAINRVVKFYGGIPYEAVYKEVEKIYNQSHL